MRKQAFKTEGESRRNGEFTINKLTHTEDDFDLIADFLLKGVRMRFGSGSISLYR